MGPSAETFRGFSPAIIGFWQKDSYLEEKSKVEDFVSSIILFFLPFSKSLFKLTEILLTGQLNLNSDKQITFWGGPVSNLNQVIT